MAKHGKKYRSASEYIDPEVRYNVDESMELLKRTAYANFDESADAAFRLNVNPRHADQMVRGSLVLPHGLGKETRVAVFATGEKAREAEAAGADFVGSDELIERITEENWLGFDVAVATPDMMRYVGRIGQILGPRGLMPSPKANTVTNDVAQIVEELKAGRTEFRVEKSGIIHISFGRASFPEEKLLDNFMEIVDTLVRLKPASAKLPYFKSISISSTMGPGIKIDTGFAHEKF
jgi:large subunit ribosomal protein L1